MHSLRTARTCTGSFSLGFRRTASEWQKDLPALIKWAVASAFNHIDVGNLSPPELREFIAAGLQIGSVDLPQSWSDLVCPDAGRRQAAAENCAAYARQVAPLGVRNFFILVIPEDKQRDRKENLSFAIDGYARLCQLMEPIGAKIVIEGAPGRPPHFATLACTPAEIRHFFREVASDVLGLNFDPSHLVRMGIDPLRFLHEFAGRVYHVHAKDTLILEDGLYDFGNLQQSAVSPPHVYGAHCWRYTIPGNGMVPWPRLLQSLHDGGYRGTISIELEDEEFFGDPVKEQEGLHRARDFLART